MESQLESPTDAELEILTILWTNGWSTVSDVFSQLSTRRNIGYTTVLKLLQIMFAKGLVQRDESRRKHLYHAVQLREVTQKQVLADVVARAFNGSVSELIRQALALGPISTQDRLALRDLIEQPATPPPPSPDAPTR